MQVMLGWSGEVEHNVWRKADVTVDEGDLNRILVFGDVEVGVAGKLSPGVAYQLLQNEAEGLLLQKMMDHGYPEAKATVRMRTLADHSLAILEAVKQKYTA